MAPAPSDAAARNRPRPCIENCSSFDVQTLQDNSALRIGTQCRVSEYIDDDLIWVAIVSVMQGEIAVTPDRSLSPSTFENVQIPFVHQPCHFGGRRVLFLCPARACQRRVARLYLLDGQFRCRTCHRLPYASQSKGRFERPLHQANKLRIALGGPPGTAFEIAPRPKGMHQTTYNRMKNRIIELEGQAWGHLADVHGFDIQPKLSTKEQ